MAKSDDGLGNLGTLDNPAMSSGLNDALGEKQKPSAAAELVAGKEAPPGVTEREIKDHSVGVEGGVSYFKDPMPKGYVAPPKEETFVEAEKTAPVKDAGIDNQHLAMQESVVELDANTRVTAQQASIEMTRENPKAEANTNIISSSQMDEDLHHQDPLNQRSQQVMTKEDVQARLEQKGHENLKTLHYYLSDHLASQETAPGVNKLAALNANVLAQDHDISDKQLAENLNRLGVAVKVEQVAKVELEDSAGRST
ncbi:MAG: hypothetical protein WBL28_04300 [Methylotenera sp.]